MTKKSESLTISSGTETAKVLSILDAQLQTLKEVTDRPYITSGMLESFGDIKTQTLLPNLIRAWSMVKNMEEAYNKAAEDLGMKTYPEFNISGGTAKQWKQDIELRISIIKYNDRKTQLESYKSKMAQFLSATEQKEMLIAEMSKFLAQGGE